MKNKQLQLVTFEQAQRLKKAGFDWPTTPYYTFSGLLIDGLARKEKMANGKYPTFFAPTVALALKWMRDVKNKVYRICSSVDYDGMREKVYLCPESWEVEYVKDGDVLGVYSIRTYETAESALLDELLTIIDNQ